MRRRLSAYHTNTEVVAWLIRKLSAEEEDKMDEKL